MKRRVDIRKEFADDRLTRAAGERLRETIVAAAGEGKSVEVDFGDAVIASTSFLDEGFAKLAEDGWTREELDARVSLVNMHPRDREIMESLFANRAKSRRR